MLTHVVLMKFTDPADAPEAKERLEGLVGTVEQITSMTVGLDLLHTDVSYDLCMTTTHDSVEELRAYQGHPAHLEVAGWLRPRLAARAVVDHES
ncbi:Stress responsive A/B Barrel Domain [Thermomonospora echinospora]|uniref:Stress responsive A/B Barrel Domain n=1 Tax=Thermomonospora echinospora TaxID=1992 RepID=A0A1H6B3X1_9ACTN|nr:Dabb family protein [Thermomonospora echinospora]SEG54836.1 Stress responsive A/B Barrel Domain [Thermomonospora echinospora]